MKRTYADIKAELRQRAIDWQNSSVFHDYSYGELAIIQDYFERKGKRYGLLREFRENGII